MIFLCRFQRQRLLCLFRFVKICRIHFLSAAFYRHNSIRKKTADRFYKTSRRFIACFIYFYSIPSSRFTSAISSGVAMLNCTASSSLICWSSAANILLRSSERPSFRPSSFSSSIFISSVIFTYASTIFIKSLPICHIAL